MKNKNLCLIIGMALAITGCGNASAVGNGESAVISDSAVNSATAGSADGSAENTTSGTQDSTANTTSGVQDTTGPQNTTAGQASTDISGNIAMATGRDPITTCYYSSDPSIYLESNRETESSVIVDGTSRIPVDIFPGNYGAQIEKRDADGDGEDEYLVSECEGTGTGISVYGLCIVEKNGDSYDLTRYNSQYFSDILEDRIRYQIDEKTDELQFLFDGTPAENDAPVALADLEKDYGKFSSIVWSDIINVNLTEDGIQILAPAGMYFEDCGMPIYEADYTVEATVLVNKDGTIEVTSIAPYEE